jgi:hypothetical protein
VLPSRTKLLDKLVKNAYAAERGTYVPVSEHVYLVGKLPDFSVGVQRVVAPFPYPYFTNTLLIPPGFGTIDFDAERAAKPIMRVTNGGFLVITIEFDGETVDEFEETLSWTREGKASESPVSTLDRELCRFEDYRGYSVVFSGRRSLQYHFIFGTEHLKGAPFKRTAAERLEHIGGEAPLLINAHRRYWDQVQEEFVRVLEPSLPVDQQLRKVTQWRRSPWGIRILEKPSPLGIPAGTHVPQIVIDENLRTRASKQTGEYCVAPTFSFADPVKRSRRRGGQASSPTSVSEEMFDDAREMCRLEWGEYPQLAQMEVDNGEWVLSFRNHVDDQRPSSVCRGDHREVLICGEGHSLEGKRHFLPEGFTANEFGEHLATMYGLRGAADAQIDADHSPPKRERRPVRDPETGKYDWTEITQRGRELGPSWLQDLRGIEAQFAEPISDVPASQLRERYRAKIPNVLWAARFNGALESLIVQSGEGIGKSMSVSSDLREALFMDFTRGRTGFGCVAFRKRDQARMKAEEFRDRGKPFRELGTPTTQIKTFWTHYEEACRTCRVEPTRRSDFDEVAPGAVLAEIRQEHQEVYNELERVRRDLWGEGSPFDDWTQLVTTHKAAVVWDTSVSTRAWHHSDFHPEASFEAHKALAASLELNRIVFDDPEYDEFVELMTEERYRLLKAQQAAHRNWRNKKRFERLAVYDKLAGQDVPDTFEDFNALMLLDLAGLEPVRVDFDAIPFGNDPPGGRGIYREKAGETYYIGAKEWLRSSSAHLTVLTTEKLVCDAVEKAIKVKTRFAGRLDLTNAPGIYPIRVPVVIDARAGADQDGKEKVSALVLEILSRNDNAVVISDGVSRDVKNERVLTFQGAKGVNGLEDRDVYIVVTQLHPDKYAQLNVLGQWLERPDVIETYYSDQINQAVGRNKGFRDNGNDRKTVLITSARLWENQLKRFQSGASRTLLYIDQRRERFGQ